MRDLVFVGDVAFDGVHLGLLAFVFSLAGLAIWLRSTLRDAISEHTQDKRRLVEDAARVTNRAELAEQELMQTRARAETAERDIAALKAVQAEMQSQFGDLAQGVLERTQKQFMSLANETFQKHHAGAKGDLEKLMEPIGETFEAFRKRVDAIEKVRVEDRSSLQEQVKAIGESLQRNTRATGKLVTALSAPRGGGSWGEESLRNVMELAGMSEHADFVEQLSDETSRGKLRPDVILRMPGGREIVIDAKVSLEDFLKASEEPDEAVRSAHLEAHARKIKDHVQRLARKEYWKDFEGRVDFVAMYVPGEQFYAAALEVDRTLFDYAARNRVIIVTPSTLVALAKAVAYGWRQEEAANNARHAAELGRQVYDALSAMGGHIERTGKSLTGAVDSYNKMVGSLERNVLPKARKFEELKLTQAGGKPLSGGDAIDEPVRLPVKTGELLFDATEGGSA